MKNTLILSLILFFAAPTAFTDNSIWKGTEKVKLENGLTVLLKEDHNQPIVTAQVWVKAGSIYENPKTYGLSHFLEHLIFKGTKNYPGDMISRTVETRGGYINAATSKEFTEYYIDIQKDTHEEAVRILADAVSGAVFPPEEIEKERLVVLEEINRHEDNPEGSLFDAFSDAVHQATAYKSRVIGSADVIRNVSRQEIIDYYRAFYIPDNMVLSVMGDFDTQKLLGLIKETFGALKSGPSQAEPRLTEPAHEPVIIRKEKKVAYTYWIGGFLGPEISDTKDMMTADVVSSILVGGRSARLYRKIREEKRLVYSIGGSFWSMRGNGVMYLIALMPPENEKKAISAVTKEIEILRDKGPTDAELKRVKEMTKSSWYFGLESYHGQASLMAYWYLLGNPDFIDRYIESIEKTTKQDVQEFLKKYYANGLNQAVLFPEKD
ncbi:MAG: pitrilysin family protein [Elusimicrobiota bacterium]